MTINMLKILRALAPLCTKPSNEQKIDLVYCDCHSRYHDIV